MTPSSVRFGSYSAETRVLVTPAPGPGDRHHQSNFLVLVPVGDLDRISHSEGVSGFRPGEIRMSCRLHSPFSVCISRDSPPGRNCGSRRDIGASQVIDLATVPHRRPRFGVQGEG